jgi:hypothetical protein
MRFQVVGTHVFGSVTVPSGGIICDYAATAQPGDYVVGYLRFQDWTPKLIPLDAAEEALKAEGFYPWRMKVPPATISGAESIGRDYPVKTPDLVELEIVKKAAAEMGVEVEELVSKIRKRKEQQ